MERIDIIDRELELAGVPLVVSQARAAEVLGVASRTMQRWCAAGIVQSATPAGRRRALIRRRELARVLADQPQAAASA